MLRKALGSIVLDRSSAASLQSQLIASLRRSIQGGQLRPGEALPSSRDLAQDLNVSRNTVLGAYDQLTSEGYLDPRPRSGLYVTGALEGQLGPVPKAAPPPPRPRPARLADPAPFRPCQPDVRLFPLPLWNRLRGHALRAHGAAILNYQSRAPLGLPVLQKALAAYLRDSRGVRCSWEQVAITSGSQQALYLLSHLLLGPGRPAYLEDPGYYGARAAFGTARARVVPLPVDSGGVQPPASLEPGSLVYTTPSRQFPTGACLPVARRLALLKAAAAAQAWILEDDYDSEYRYARPPLPSLHSLDAAGRVIYLGSMSKVLFPALRIGYAVLPPELIEPFGDLRAIVDDHGPLIDQAVLAEFLEGGYFYTHIRRCRKEYAARLAVFLETARSLGLPFEFAHTEGGMNLMGTCLRSLDPRRLAEQGLDIPALTEYSIRAAPHGFLFGFTAFDPPAIRAGLRRLQAATGA